jgi:hypothetical protein
MSVIWTGTDVMILEVFSPKKLTKKFTILTQINSYLCRNNYCNIGFPEKRYFSGKM